MWYGPCRTGIPDDSDIIASISPSSGPTKRPNTISGSSTLRATTTCDVGVAVAGGGGRWTKLTKMTESDVMATNLRRTAEGLRRLGVPSDYTSKARAGCGERGHTWLRFLRRGLSSPREVCKTRRKVVQGAPSGECGSDGPTSRA